MKVDISQITPLYANTSPGLTADAGVVDPAVAALVTAVNTNDDNFVNFIGALFPTPGELAIPDQSIVTRHLRNLAVTNPKLAALAVTADKIADGSITLTKLADMVVTAAKIADRTITEPKMANGSVSRRMIQAGAVGANEIDPTILAPITDSAVQVKFNQIDEQLAETSKHQTSWINVKQPPYNAKTNGVDVDNVAIQKAIDDLSATGGGTVFLPNSVFLIDVVVSINLKSNVSLLLDKNTILKAQATDNSNYKIINIEGVSNVSVQGGKLFGERSTHIGTTGEWGMGINVRGSNNVYISDVDIDDCWGDALYIGSTAAQNYCNNIVVERFKFNNNRRQGISIISAKNLTIRNGLISNTNGTGPSDGIDIEPNVNTEHLQNIVIENVRTENNAGSGIKFYAGFYAESLNAVSIIIKNHTDKNSEFGVRFREYIPGVTGFIKLENCEWENGNSYMFFTQDWAATGPRIEVFDCTAIWTGTASDKYPFNIGRPNQMTDGHILGNVHLFRPNLIVKSGATPPDRGIYVSPNSAALLTNVSIIDPVSMKTTLADTQVGFSGSVSNITISDRYKIIHQSLTTNLTINNFRYKRSYDNKNATTDINIVLPTIGPEVEFTINCVETSKITITPQTGKIIYPYETTSKAISTNVKGSSITIKLGLDGDYYVTNITGTWVF